MTTTTVTVTDELHEYLLAHGTPPDEIQRELIAETTAMGGIASMQIAAEQGALMTLLTRMVNASFAVEVGTFTGYSSICIARGLAPGGKLLCCDLSQEWTDIARGYWARAGVADAIELKLAPAAETLRALPQIPMIDIAFIDADKSGYIAYWEEIVPRMRQGGIILVDNVLWSGEVVKSDDNTANTTAIRQFNVHARDDKRVELVMLPIADGLTIARKR